MSVRLFVLCFTSICCEICFCPNIASILSISMCLPKLQSTELSWPPSLILLSNSKAFREVNSKNSGGSCWLYQTMPPCYISYILWRAMHVCLFLCRLVMYIERDLRKTAPLRQNWRSAYLSQCLDLLVGYLSNTSSTLLGTNKLPLLLSVLLCGYFIGMCRCLHIKLAISFLTPFIYRFEFSYDFWFKGKLQWLWQLC